MWFFYTGGSSGIPSSGLRPPSRPPVTQAVEPSMHRTTSLGNLSANKKLTIPPASSNRPPIAHPPNGATAVNGIARNGGGGVAPKIVTSSRLVRPFAAPAKLPNLPPPTGVPSALSRIPKTTAAVKKWFGTRPISRSIDRWIAWFIVRLIEWLKDWKIGFVWLACFLSCAFLSPVRKNL